MDLSGSVGRVPCYILWNESSAQEEIGGRISDPGNGGEEGRENRLSADNESVMDSCGMCALQRRNV